VLKVKKYFDSFLEILLVLIFISMFVIALIQVFTRFVLNDPASWTEELARYLMVWMAFIGAGVGLKYGLHMSLDIITERITGRASFILQLLSVIFIMICGLLIVVYGNRLTAIGRERISMALFFSMDKVFVIIPISGCIIVLNSAENLWRVLKKK